MIQANTKCPCGDPINPKGAPRKIATIDLGTNSVLMLVSEIDAHQQITILRDEIQTPRLGEGLHAFGVISDEALLRACNTLEQYRKLAIQYGVNDIYPFATAAVREAKNQSHVLSKLSASIGVNVELISGQKEASLTFLSATFENPASECVVVDIGGGSTEIALGEKSTYQRGHSYKIGTVKLFDAFFRHEISQKNIDEARTLVQKHFATHELKNLPSLAFGTAGSFTHLASIEMSLETYSSEAVNGFNISKPMISKWIEKCQRSSLQELSKLKGADPRRMDLLLPGFIIIEQLFECFGIETFVVKDRGMRFGKLFEVLPDIKLPLRFL